MILAERFRFDHEAADSPRIAAVLARLTLMGVELGAEVSLYRCFVCDVALATFQYPEDPPQ
jgi:hypothetical protein